MLSVSESLNAAAKSFSAVSNRKKSEVSNLLNERFINTDLKAFKIDQYIDNLFRIKNIDCISEKANKTENTKSFNSISIKLDKEKFNIQDGFKNLKLHEKILKIKRE